MGAPASAPLGVDGLICPGKIAMDPEHSPGEQACKTRVDLLRQLADSLERAHAAVVRSDLSEITRQTACQQELCARLRQLPAEGVRTQPDGLSPPVRDRNHAVREELVEVKRKVAQLNRRYALLLRRARRTVDIFCRVLENAALTYPPPRPQAPTLAAGFQE